MLRTRDPCTQLNAEILDVEGSAIAERVRGVWAFLLHVSTSRVTVVPLQLLPF